VGYSVLVMLLALSVQIGTGLFAVDVDGLESGPMSHYVTFDQGRLAAGIHEVSFNVLLGVIAAPARDSLLSDSPLAKAHAANVHGPRSPDRC
jgi:cytochrome b